MRCALGQVKDRPLPRRPDRPSTGHRFNLGPPQLHQLPPAAAIALRRQVADSPNRKTARALTTLGGVEPANGENRCWRRWRSLVWRPCWPILRALVIPDGRRCWRPQP